MAPINVLVVIGAVLLAGLAVAGRPTRRKDVESLTPDELLSYREAVEGALANGQYAKVAGWHGLPLLGTSTNGTCAHGTVGFLLWHRFYLGIMEMVLGCPIPFWDWGKPTLPTAFTDKTYVGRDGSVRMNPLKSAPLPAGTMSISNPRPVTYRQPSDPFPTVDLVEKEEYALFGVNTFGEFAVAMEDCQNLAHTSLGGSISSIDVAAFDPMFWSLHMNVERLFFQWQLMHDDYHYSKDLLDSFIILETFEMPTRELINFFDGWTAGTSPGDIDVWRGLLQNALAQHRPPTSSRFTTLSVDPSPSPPPTLELSSSNGAAVVALQGDALSPLMPGARHPVRTLPPMTMYDIPMPTNIPPTEMPKTMTMDNVTTMRREPAPPALASPTSAPAQKATFDIFNTRIAIEATPEPAPSTPPPPPSPRPTPRLPLLQFPPSHQGPANFSTMMPSADVTKAMSSVVPMTLPPLAPPFGDDDAVFGQVVPVVVPTPSPSLPPSSATTSQPVRPLAPAPTSLPITASSPSSPTAPTSSPTAPSPLSATAAAARAPSPQAPPGDEALIFNAGGPVVIAQPADPPPATIVAAVLIGRPPMKAPVPEPHRAPSPPPEAHRAPAPVPHRPPPPLPLESIPTPFLDPMKPIGKRLMLTIMAVASTAEPCLLEVEIDGRIVGRVGMYGMGRWPSTAHVMDRHVDLTRAYDRLGLGENGTVTLLDIEQRLRFQMHSIALHGPRNVQAGLRTHLDWRFF